MFDTILLPVDLSEHNDVALAAAERLAGDGGARVTLFHVIETIDGVPFEEMEGFYRGLERRAEGLMAPWAERLSAVGIETSRRVVFGHRVEEVVAFAEESGSDLVLLRSHAVDPDHPGRGWATVSYQVAALAPCPVLLVK